MALKSFWAAIQKIAPVVDKAATVAAAFLPGKAGQIAGGVAEGAEVGPGVVGTIVNQLAPSPHLTLPGTALQPASTQQVQVVAASADDHEARIKALEKLAGLSQTS